MERTPQMINDRSRAAQRRYRREAEAICTSCGGTGRVHSESIRDRARKGGNASFLQSLGPDRPSMSERGSRGGRPRSLTLVEIRARSHAPGSRESKGDGT